MKASELQITATMIHNRKLDLAEMTNRARDLYNNGKFDQADELRPQMNCVGSEIAGILSLCTRLGVLQDVCALLPAHTERID
jgi:hypothetical protein